MIIATIADLVERIPVLWNPDTKQFGASTNIMMQLLDTAGDAVNQELELFYGDITLAEARFTFPLRLSVQEESKASWGLELHKITPKTANATLNEYIIIEALSDKDYKVTGNISGALGEGDKEDDFTSSDDSFKILSASWSTEDIDFVIGDRFIFSRTWYESAIHLLASTHAAHHIIEGRYMSEASNDLDFGNNSFDKQYNKLRDSLISPNKPTTLIAPNASYRDPGFVETQTWEAPYSINNLGLDE